MNAEQVLERLRSVQERARRQADRDGWRPWPSGHGPHPSFAALHADALAILAEHGVTATERQSRTLAWLSRDEVETLADVVALIVVGRVPLGGDAA